MIEPGKQYQFRPTGDIAKALSYETCKGEVLIHIGERAVYVPAATLKEIKGK